MVVDAMAERAKQRGYRLLQVAIVGHVAEVVGGRAKCSSNQSRACGADSASYSAAC
jgi:hypothetical protein